MAHDYASDPRLNDAERSRAVVGTCVQQTAYGLPWVEYCTDDRHPRDLYYCASHREENRELYGTVFDAPAPPPPVPLLLW